PVSLVAESALQQLRKKNRQVDWHRCSPLEWLQQHQVCCREAVALGELGVKAVSASLLKRVTDDRNLLLAIDYLTVNGGAAAGPDGWSPADLTPDIKFQYARGMRDDLRRGGYEHGESLIRMIPKKGGRGRRRVQLLNLEDR